NRDHRDRVAWFWQGSEQSQNLRGIEIQRFGFRSAIADADSAGRLEFETIPIDRGLQNFAQCSSQSVDAGTRKTGAALLREEGMDLYSREIAKPGFSQCGQNVAAQQFSVVPSGANFHGWQSRRFPLLAHKLLKGNCELWKLAALIERPQFGI